MGVFWSLRLVAATAMLAAAKSCSYKKRRLGAIFRALANSNQRSLPSAWQLKIILP